jgi:hypothetical protein
MGTGVREEYVKIANEYYYKNEISVNIFCLLGASTFLIILIALQSINTVLLGNVISEVYKMRSSNSSIFL